MITTAEAIIERAKREQPNLRLAVSASGGAIGAWCESLGRYVMVAGRMVGNHGAPEDWVDMPYELLINGEPPVNDWVEA